MVTFSICGCCFTICWTVVWARFQTGPRWTIREVICPTHFPAWRRRRGGQLMTLSRTVQEVLTLLGSMPFDDGTGIGHRSELWWPWTAAHGQRSWGSTHWRPANSDQDDRRLSGNIEGAPMEAHWGWSVDLRSRRLHLNRHRRRSLSKTWSRQRSLPRRNKVSHP